MAGIAISEFLEVVTVGELVSISLVLSEKTAKKDPSTSIHFDIGSIVHEVEINVAPVFLCFENEKAVVRYDQKR